MPLKVNLHRFAGTTLQSRILLFSDHHFCMHVTDHSIDVLFSIPQLDINRHTRLLPFLSELRFLESLAPIEGQAASFCGTYHP